MAVTPDPRTLRAMEEAIATPPGDGNPFVREDNKTYLRYDQIQLRQQPNGLISGSFYWRGKLVYTLFADCNFRAGQMLTLHGVEGRMVARATATL